MPIEFGIWRIGEGVTPVPSSPLANEEALEDILEQDLSILGLDVLLLIGRQVVTSLGKRLDLLAMDSEGNLHAIELKRGRTPRDVVAQTIDYGFWLRDLGREEIVDVFERHNEGKDFEEAYRERFDQPVPETLNESHQLVIVASELDPATERIISYVSDYGVPVNVVFFQHFRDGDREYLARSWLIDPVDAEVRPSRSATGTRRPRAPWNGQDFYVSFGDGEGTHDRRRWEDAMKYGFVSGGGAPWFSRTLSMLFPSARVFACIPQLGYVGVGIVRESVQRVADFNVTLNGQLVPILEAPLLSSNMGKGAEDDDASEYLVRVEWIKTLPKSEAFWEKRMYANQNTATRMRNLFTLERLIEHFGLGENEEND